MYSHPRSLFYQRGDDISKDGANVELLQFAENEFQHLDTADVTTICSMYNDIKSSNVSVVSSNSQFVGLPNSLNSTEAESLDLAVEEGQFLLHKGGLIWPGNGGGGGGTLRNGQFIDWGHYSHQKKTSTDNEVKQNQLTGLIVGDSTDPLKGRIRDQKELVKLAQNREAARKSRMRKKAYVQELEISQQRLTQLDHALTRARERGMLVSSEYYSNCVRGSGFDTDHARWAEEHQTLIDDLRRALNSDVGDTQMRVLVDAAVSHYDRLFGIKKSGVKSDMFHILSGLWRSPVERCLMWFGGFRSSDMLKVVEKKIQPLTELQLVGICNLQQWCQQAEDAVSQGMEDLQRSLVGTMSRSSDDMSQMAVAMSKIAKIENFLNQADLLRLHTLQRLQRILTTRQAACALLAINSYNSRLQALSSLWVARPKG